MSDSLGLKFLYRTPAGRMILKELTKPSLSKKAGRLLSSKASSLIVPLYVKANGIDMSPYVIPEGGYKSFNDFFVRKLKVDALPDEDAVFSSPCDGLLTVKQLRNKTSFFVKGQEYRLSRLLGNDALAREFVGGTAFIFRLTPKHYHRYKYAASGTVLSKKHIYGRLHTVRPIAIESMPVFIENTREYITIDTEKIGKVLQMEVGALMVGKIKNRPVFKGERVSDKTEKGHFMFGGSTIIVLTSKRLDLCTDIMDSKKNEYGEIGVTAGQTLVK